MSRIEISAGGRHIIVDHDGELAHVADTATRLWESTHGTDSPGGGMGFTSTQRYERPASPSTMRRGPGRVDAQKREPDADRSGAG